MRFFRPLVCVAFFIGAVTPLIAQDTPTEREAARDVLQKLATLQRTVGVTTWATRLAAPDAVRDRVAARAKALMDGELLAMADDITKHPEIGFDLGDWGGKAVHLATTQRSSTNGTSSEKSP